MKNKIPYCMDFLNLKTNLLLLPVSTTLTWQHFKSQ